MTTLTMKDEKRLDVIQRVYRSELTVGQAALIMGLSERQCYRVKARVSKAGAKGVVHGNRGRSCKRKTKEKTVKRILELARVKYQGFNDHHLTEKLKEQESISLSREKVRRILRAEGIRSPNKRRGLKHRSRRERRPAEGMMLQVDGSPHDWLQGRGPRLCLIGALDDATSKVMGALFVEAESSSGLLSSILRSLQCPWSPPVDLHRLSLGVLDRSGADTGGAAAKQEALNRSGSGLSGTRSDFDSGPLPSGQGED
jgi:transposase